MTNRFNQVETKVDTLTGVVSANTLSLTSISTTLGEIKSKVNDTYTKVEGINNLIGTSTSTGTDTVFGKLNDITTKVDTINTNTGDTNTKITNLSTVIGNSSSASDDNTLYGLLRFVNGRAYNIQVKLGEIETSINTIKANTSVNTITSSTISALASYYNTTWGSTSGQYEDKMADVIQWLRDNGYLR